MLIINSKNKQFFSTKFDSSDFSPNHSLVHRVVQNFKNPVDRYFFSIFPLVNLLFLTWNCLSNSKHLYAWWTRAMTLFDWVRDADGLLCQRVLFSWSDHRCRISTWQNRKWLYFPASCSDREQGCLLAIPLLSTGLFSCSCPINVSHFLSLSSLHWHGEGQEGVKCCSWQESDRKGIYSEHQSVRG